MSTIHVMAFSGRLNWFSLCCRRNLIPVVTSAEQRRIPCSVPEVEYALRLARRLVIANQGEGNPKRTSIN